MADVTRRRASDRLGQRNLYLIGYGILVFFGVLGFLRVEYLNLRVDQEADARVAQVEQESIERTHQICVTQNRQNEIVIQFAHLLREFVGSQDESEALADARDGFVADVERELAPQECPPPADGP